MGIFLQAPLRYSLNGDSLFSVGQMKEMRISANAKNHAMFTRGGEPEPPIDSDDTDSILQGSLATFLTEFFENGGPGGH